MSYGIPFAKVELTLAVIYSQRFLEVEDQIGNLLFQVSFPNSG